MSIVEKMTIGGNGVESCPSAALLATSRRALRMITGKWALEIIQELVLGGTLRFGELRKSIPGITQHMLTARLRQLETDGLVTRHIHAEVPPRVDYALTPAAMALRPVFEALMRWSGAHGSALGDGELRDGEEK